MQDRVNNLSSYIDNLSYRLSLFARPGPSLIGIRNSYNYYIALVQNLQVEDSTGQYSGQIQGLSNKLQGINHRLTLMGC